MGERLITAGLALAMYLGAIFDALVIYAAFCY